MQSSSLCDGGVTNPAVGGRAYAARLFKYEISATRCFDLDR